MSENAINKALRTIGCLVGTRGRHTIAVFLLILLPALFVPSVESIAEEHKMPYGSSCFNHYGARGKIRSISHAIGAVRKYFAKRGNYVKLVSHAGRFLTVEVYDGQELVDTVIVDIRSGKMRSVK